MNDTQPISTTLKVNTNRIPGDVVNKNTADLPAKQRNTIRQLYQVYADRNYSLADLGKMLMVSDTMISLVFNGKYTGRLDDFCERVTNFFHFDNCQDSLKKVDFIETDLTRKIEAICDMTREFQRISLIFGDWQIGKTETLLHYRNTHNRLNTIYTTVPSNGSPYEFSLNLAEALYISTHLNRASMHRRIKNAIGPDMLLIVDEAHQAIPFQDRRGGERKIETIEFIREIYNECHCGVLLSATNVFQRAMDDKNSPLYAILGQTKRRRLCTLNLPSITCHSDLNKFAAAYGLPPATGKVRDLEHRINKEEALGMWLNILRLGKKISLSRKQPMEWSHVVDAYAALKEMERVPGSEEVDQ